MTVQTPAGAERQALPSATSVGASGRNWGPGGWFPPWDLRRWTEMALWFAMCAAVLFVVTVGGACVVYTFGDLAGLWPLRSRMTAEERAGIVKDTRDEVLEVMEKEGWKR